MLKSGMLKNRYAKNAYGPKCQNTHGPKLWLMSILTFGPISIFSIPGFLAYLIFSIPDFQRTWFLAYQIFSKSFRGGFSERNLKQNKIDMAIYIIYISIYIYIYINDQNCIWLRWQPVGCHVQDDHLGCRGFRSLNLEHPGGSQVAANL